MMRLRNIRIASCTRGSDAATIEAMDQIGLVSATTRSKYQRIAEAMKTLTAKRTPSRSWLAKPGHFMVASRLGAYRGAPSLVRVRRIALQAVDNAGLRRPQRNPVPRSILHV